MSESVERGAHDLEASRFREEEVLKARQENDKVVMDRMQRLRRETLEGSHARELADMQAAHKAARDQLEALLRVEAGQLNDVWNAKRSEMAARHSAELKQLGPAPAAAAAAAPPAAATGADAGAAGSA
jgi:hypothetical protein